jgi:F0F1-type ATP synthase assembly protein I
MGKNQPDRPFYLLGLRVVGDFGATLAIPVVVLSWLGKTLDTRWGTKPFLLIAGFLAAAALSAVSIFRKAKRYEKELRALSAPKTPEQPS